MKAYYFDNNGYNGILLESKSRAIIYDDMIDGLDINKDNIDRIVENWREYGLDDQDFYTMYGQELSSLMYSDDAMRCLDEQDEYELIYET